MNILKICTYYLIISFSLIFSIGIAGIVLFLENIANYKEKQTIVKLKKANSLIAQAVNKSRTEYGDLHELENDIIEFFRNAVTKQLKVVKTCTLPHNYPGAERTAAMSKYRKKEA